MNFYPWLLFLHILSALAFFFAHGASGVIAFRLPREEDPQRLRLLLDLSSYTSITYSVAMLGVVLFGTLLGFMGHWWNHIWIWASLALFFLIVPTLMYLYSTTHFHRLRRALGMAYLEGIRTHPAGEPANIEEIIRIARSINPWGYTLIGFLGTALILWLMIFKPF